MTEIESTNRPKLTTEDNERFVRTMQTKGLDGSVGLDRAYLLLEQIDVLRARVSEQIDVLRARVSEERERVLTTIRARRQQYRVDGWQPQADAMSLLLDEIEKR